MSHPEQFVDEEGPTQIFERVGRGAVTAPGPASRDRLWDANDVAAYLKVSRSWVYHRAEAGQLPCVRVGGLLRFDPAAIRAAARGEVVASRRAVAFPTKSPRR
jgi:excisionase family DNA binding protein